MVSLSDDTDVVVGVRAREEDLKFNEAVLDFTMRRPLRTQSFFCDEGCERHDAEAMAKLRTGID